MSAGAIFVAIHTGTRSSTWRTFNAFDAFNSIFNDPLISRNACKILETFFARMFFLTLNNVRWGSARKDPMKLKWADEEENRITIFPSYAILIDFLSFLSHSSHREFIVCLFVEIYVGVNWCLSLWNSFANHTQISRWGNTKRNRALWKLEEK